MIQDAFDEVLHRTNALTLSIGERRHIQSRLFHELSAEQLRSYEEHAEAANADLQKEFDDEAISDATLYE